MRNTPQSLIQLDNITKEYPIIDSTVRVLDRVSLTIRTGEFVAITGPSGSGKSTLMHIIGLLDNPTAGKYLLEGNDVTTLSDDQQAAVRNTTIGFVFQSFNLLSRASALENVMLPSVYAQTPPEQAKIRARELLNDLGLAERLMNRPNQLSGGQQQRVAIARALMNDPSIILADEPTGNLDTKSGLDVLRILKKLNSKGKTIILITHEPDIAREASRSITIRDGRIIA